MPRLAFSERRLLLRLGDLLLISASIMVSLFLWLYLSGGEFYWELFQIQFQWIGLIFFGWPIWFFFNDMYNLRHAAQVGRTARVIGTGALLLMIVYLGIFFVTSRPPTNPNLNILLVESTPVRLAPVFALVISTTLLFTWRTSYAILFGGPHARRRLAILGVGHSARALYEAIRQTHQSHYEVVGFVDEKPSDAYHPEGLPPLLGDPQRLLQLEGQIDEIVLAKQDEIRGEVFQIIMDCHERGMAVTPMPLLYERLTGKVPVEHIGSDWYVALPFQEAGTRTLYSFIKRLMDLAGGLLIGLVFLIVLPFVALAIKLDSSGPIFYSQERVGANGRPFRVRKFRSMVQDAEGDGKARWATKNDSRITRVGALLRKTRLDELPQVLNVLAGEMSLVGPRPERAQFIEQLQRQIPFYRTRLAVKPGLTGWAQVSYGYGATVEDALIKLQYDLFYIRHQNPWFDFTIMLRTIGVVLKMKGQ
jgi:exopolysaccharide biosynthesis polyprenyl glycosylphosphotransferase